MRWALVGEHGEVIGRSSDLAASTASDLEPLLGTECYERLQAAISSTIADAATRRLASRPEFNEPEIDVLAGGDRRSALVQIHPMPSESSDDAQRTALRSLAQRNAAILRSSMDGFFVVDAEGRFLEVNEAFCRMLGYSSDELLATSITTLEMAAEEAGLAAAHTRTGLHHFSTAHRHKLGYPVHLELSINVLQDFGRKLLVGFARDVTERLRAEAQLARLSRQQRLILDAVDEGIIGLNRDRRVIFANPAAARMLGTLPGRLIGISFEELSAAPLPCGRAAPVESQLRRPDGTEFPVELSATAVHDGDISIGAVAVFKDLTQRKRAETERAAHERQAQQRQRIESLGLLAGGVAHDLNNVLVGILGNAYLAESLLPDAAAVRDRLTRVIAACERASKVIRQMLAFAGQAACERTPLCINDEVHCIADFMRAGVPRNIELDLNLQPGELLVSADGGQLQQILTNLVVNAIDAIGDKQGRIVVSTRSATLSTDDRARLFPAMEIDSDDVALITVVDTGCGIDAAELPRIFEPFYTTKGAGRGLGLSALQGIVRAHGGGVRVESRPNAGTQFTIALPIHAGPRATSADSCPAAPPDASWTVLVIDDEPEIREVVELMLSGHCRRTLTAADGIEGLRVLEREAAAIDAVVLDMTMPKMSGAEVFRRIRAAHPLLPVIVVSGYSERSLSARLADACPPAILAKPFSRDALIQKLHDAIAPFRPALSETH